ncbi:MAG: aminotransferase class I/II-fold pyridoxal phosphate-dependent enzyme [Rhodospirillales bacterium]|nr:aminotransferase class I/II-fold pyridoxal phosphate-dependent enzyme [Rhodospirillales bacterium]
MSVRPKAAARGAIAPFIVMDVLRAANERAAAGQDVLHLEVGQPSAAAPSRVRRAAARALRHDRIGYTDALGHPPLRQAIARDYRDRQGVDLDWRRVVVATGSSGAFVLAFLAAFDAGDRVALASPGYPAYRNILRALDVEVIEIQVDAGSNFQPTPAHLDAVAPPLHGLIVASPANPTGTMLHRSELFALADACAERGIRLVSDEIYHGITYGPTATTALERDDAVIVVNSFSKYYAMTGWRLGWMVVPEELLRPVECLAQNLFISPPTLSQFAAVEALSCRSELDGHVARYGENRALLMELLPQAGFGRFAEAEGAFYLYVDVSEMSADSTTLCREILQHTGVAITPGVDFDPRQGHRFVRFSYAGSHDHMAEAARRLIAWRGH